MNLQISTGSVKGVKDVKGILKDKILTRVIEKTIEIKHDTSDTLDTPITKLTLFHCWTTDKTFRVAIGKGKWSNYNPYNTDPEYKHDWNLREILKNEIVVEFDTDNKQLALQGIKSTAIKLINSKISFEIWSHCGKSPHLHIRNLPISHLDKVRLKEFKKFFIKKIVPSQFHNVVDLSLCGIHLVALEDCEHWKKKYGVKRLIQEWKNE